MDTWNKRVGKRVIQARTARNLQAADVARLLGVSATKQSRIESGLRKADTEYVAKLSEVLRVPLDFLLMLSDRLDVNVSEELPALRPAVKSVTPVNRRNELEVFGLKPGKGKQAVPGWLNLAAGKGGFLERCPEVWVIPKLAMARGIHTAIIRGDSMLETLQPGDVAILQELNNGQGTVLPAKESQDDKMPLQMWERQIPGNRIFALSLDGGQTLTIKRIRYQGKGADWYMLIEADNPAEFDARVVSSKDEVIVYAMLIGLGER